MFEQKIFNYNRIKKVLEIVKKYGDVLYLNRLISIFAREGLYRLQNNELKARDLLA